MDRRGEGRLGNDIRVGIQQWTHYGANDGDDYDVMSLKNSGI